MAAILLLTVLMYILAPPLMGYSQQRHLLPSTAFAAPQRAIAYALPHVAYAPPRQQPLPLRPTRQAITAAAATSDAAAQAPIRTILALGDGYTIGESVLPSEGWPMQLADQLRAKGIAIGGVDVVAQAGWRTDDLQAALEGKAQGDQPKPQGWAAAFLMAAPKGSLLQKEYDVVALQIGGSDRMEGKSVEQYGADFEALLKLALTKTGGDASRIFVLSIPDSGAAPADVATGIDAYNSVNKDLAAANGIGYVDITAISRKGATDASLITWDGVYPSAKMYREWVSLMVDDVTAALDAKG
uniref:SGNH hydrolase-type esterase domain-containing protein n=1 Tax=Eutreptiella gymnastica TaxID=73025 RepID=A0A7S4G9Z4_9EUGL